MLEERETRVTKERKGAEGEGGREKRYAGDGEQEEEEERCQDVRKKSGGGGVKCGDVSTKGLLLRNTHFLLFPLIIPLQDKGEGSSDGWREKK